MSNENVKELSLEEYVKILNGSLVYNVSYNNQNQLKLYKDISNKNDLQKRILFSFPNHNDENNIINNDNDENKINKGKVEVRTLDDLINIRTNIVSELLKQDRKKYSELEASFCTTKLVLPKEVDLNNPESMNECDKLKISYSDDQQYILDGFIKGFGFDQLQVLTENKPTEDFVKLCVILWRFMHIHKEYYGDAFTYRSDVIEHLTYSSEDISEDINEYGKILYAFLNKIATVPNINLAFETMKRINVDDMKLSGAVKDDFKKFVGTLRECNLKIVIQNGHMKAVCGRELSLKKLALALGCPITLILTLMFIYNLIHVFIPISLGVNILLLVIAIVFHIAFEVINIRKRILHIPCMHTKLCGKECNLGFDLDCYDYPENEKPEIEIPKRTGGIITQN